MSKDYIYLCLKKRCVWREPHNLCSRFPCPYNQEVVRSAKNYEATKRAERLHKEYVELVETVEKIKPIPRSRRPLVSIASDGVRTYYIDAHQAAEKVGGQFRGIVHAATYQHKAYDMYWRFRDEQED